MLITWQQSQFYQQDTIIIIFHKLHKHIYILKRLIRTIYYIMSNTKIFLIGFFCIYLD